MTRIAAILAGGKSSRMGGADKALVRLAGERLIDCVVAQLRPQADLLLISGKHDYGTGLTAVVDADSGAQGPAAGVLAIGRWVLSHAPAAPGFLTAPVDGPRFPDDLLVRLAADGTTAIASDDSGDHPTFAFWAVQALAAGNFQAEPSLSLQALAVQCGARIVRWSGAGRFVNINSPEDLAAASKSGSSRRT